MKVTMIGWYGSETLGDRGILLGIIELLSRKFGQCDYTFASFNPFFTERCIEEDLKFIKQIDPAFNCKIIDSRKTKIVKQNIKRSDFLAIGGGPLMSIGSMYALDYYIYFAAKNRIPILNLGTGIGDLKGHYTELAKNIIKNCTVSIFRDKYSLDLVEQMLGKSTNRSFTFDPAILPCRQYKRVAEPIIESGTTVCRVNIRNFPASTYTSSTTLDIEQFQKDYLQLLALTFDKVELIPMHNFFYGKDDRLILSKLRQDLNIDNITVVHYPLNLFDLYTCYSQADFVVGMRYHSVVFQTLLNGNNSIIDYTPRGRGKITGFLETVNNYSNGFNAERYFNLFDVDCNLQNVTSHFFDKNNAVIVSDDVYKKTISDYDTVLDTLSF